jgi:F0F1-type ATP synthase assembly protein I
VRSARVKLKAYGKYGSIGFELVVSMAVGYLIGKWLDPSFGGKGYVTALFSVAGVYAGFRSLFKAAKTMQADIEKEEKLDRGEAPWKVPMPEVDYDAFDDAHDAEEKAKELAKEREDEAATKDAAEATGGEPETSKEDP